MSDSTHSVFYAIAAAGVWLVVCIILGYFFAPRGTDKERALRKVNK